MYFDNYEIYILSYPLKNNFALKAFKKSKIKRQKQFSFLFSNDILIDKIINAWSMISF